MNYVILTLIVMAVSLIYERLKPKISKNQKIFFLLIICLLLCGFAGLRNHYNDTRAYVKSFQNTPESISSIFEGEWVLGTAYLHKIFEWFIYHFISKDYHVYFFIASAFLVVPVVKCIDKYSDKFAFSMFLVMTSGLYLFSLAALRQAISMGVLILAADAFIQNRYKKFVALVLIASSFHLYAILFIVLISLKKDRIFDVRMLAVCAVILYTGFTMTQFSIYFSEIAEVMGKEMTSEELNTGSVSVLRAAVYTAPLILAFITRKQVNYKADKRKNVFIILSVISGALMIMAMFGNPILLGRLPYYFLYGTVISVPYIINRGLDRQSARLVSIIAIMCYCVYELYQLRVDGAFGRDVFDLMWF